MQGSLPTVGSVCHLAQPLLFINRTAIVAVATGSDKTAIAAQVAPLP